MNSIYKAGIHVITLLSMFLSATLSKNEYSWMEDIDPSMVQLPTDSQAPIKLFITLVALALAIAGQSIILKTSKLTREKTFSFGLILLASAVWWIVFYVG